MSFFFFLGGRSLVLIHIIDQLSSFWIQADFIEELFHGRFMEEQFTPAMLTAYHWQVFTHIPHPPPLLLLLLLSLEMAICNMHLKFINVHMHALLGGM